VEGFMWEGGGDGVAAGTGGGGAAHMGRQRLAGEGGAAPGRGICVGGGSGLGQSEGGGGQCSRRGQSRKGGNVGVTGQGPEAAQGAVVNAP
ncbi:hypothetical protein KI387_015984, partial [Taxus chinensis]